MTDTPRKKLSITRKPKSETATSAEPSPEDQAGQPERTIKRPAKRRIVRNDLATKRKPAPATATKAKKRPPRKNKKKALVSPSDLKAQALDLRLQEFAVWSTFVPLAKGIDKTIFKLANDEAFAGASKKVVQKLLRMHTNHARYLQAVSRGGMRYHLNGWPDAAITDHERQLAAKMQAQRAGRVLPK